MRLFTSHWRSPLLKDVDAVIVGVSRGTPRRAPAYAYRVLRSLAPNARAWNTDGREMFERAYSEQLEALGAKILSDLEEIAGNRACVLLCWERLADPGEWCHRRMLADYIERETGIVVPELRAGDLPRRPDSPQQSLFDLPREEKA